MSEEAEFVGHLLVLPATDGSESMIDCDDITSITTHRADGEVTAIRMRGSSYTYFVARPIEVVKRWVREGSKR